MGIRGTCKKCGRIIRSESGCFSWWGAVLSHVKKFHPGPLVNETRRMIAEKRTRLRFAKVEGDERD